ncbi:hypothetical protein MW887_010730 [Aspergillus wentii]|nr:hypothetical protein MW887_010730 [Aspergillus wentii]
MSNINFVCLREVVVPIESPQTCAAVVFSKGWERRCRFPVQIDRENLLSALEKLQGIGTSDTDIDKTLLQIAHTCLCPRWHKKVSINAVQHWKAQLDQTKIVTPQKNPETPTKMKSAGSRQRTPSSLPPIVSLGEKDLESGYIYAISHSSAGEGKYKIGFSKHRPDKQRLKTHEKCYPGLSIPVFYEFPRARRFEQLILRVLGDRRIQHTCHRCPGGPTQHTEWVVANRQYVKEALYVWSQLADTGFYLPNGCLNPQFTLPVASFSADSDRWMRWAKDQLAIDQHSPLEPSPTLYGSANFEFASNDNSMYLDDDENVPYPDTPLQGKISDRNPTRVDLITAVDRLSLG